MIDHNNKIEIIIHHIIQYELALKIVMIELSLSDTIPMIIEQ